jgi:putative membrane protein
MKTYILISVTLIMMSCNNNQSDPVKSAENANEQKDKQGVTRTDDDDAQFMVHAASGGLMEVALGQAAQTLASNPQVKEFGSMMVRDHTRANDDLKTAAAARNITIPASMGNDEQKKTDDLMKKTGNDFDRDYMDMMVSDHKKDIKEFEDASEDAHDPGIKAFALKTLPVLRTHLDSAISINDRLK